jgi:hypothetical protein
MLLVMQRKRWTKNLHDTFCVTEREASNQVVADFPFFISFPFFIHVCFCVFLLVCWGIEHGGKQIKFQIQFFQYYVVEELCIVTDLVWVETEILFS